MAGRYPYHRKRVPARAPVTTPPSDGTYVDLTAAWPLPAGDPVAMARERFDTRAAAAINATTGLDGSGDSGPPRIWPELVVTQDGPAEPWYRERDLLELKWYGEKAPTVYHLRAKCLAVLAYADYFPERPDRGRGLRSMVSRAILAASPGWCGTFGPGVDDLFSLEGEEGNYDMSEMFLVAIAYRHYWDISPAAREHLITQLLARGRVHRPRKDDTFTSGSNPNDWGRAGFISFLAHHTDIGETENHILMILTARYLTNQLMFRREPITAYDNLRNGGEDYPACTTLLVALLRRILAGDFSEYNAKSYQSETRHALLNLCTYAYDHEVRLGARMVLDYLSARMAVSSNDLRRLLPFRRRNNPKNSAHTGAGYMAVGLLEWQSGADPMSPYFAMQAGNLRAYRPLAINDPGADLALEVLSAYRLPPAIHALFVDDRHRRFFQRLHRTRRDEVAGNRNADNMEIYAGSPSYLITAGGGPAPYAVNPDLHAFLDPEHQSQQLGVAVTTTFMATGDGATGAMQLIQLGEFSRMVTYTVKLEILGWDVAKISTMTPKGVANYGVAPDFACGHQVWLPDWVNAVVTRDLDGNPVDPRASAGFSFVDMGGAAPGNTYGFFLAIYQQAPGGLAVLEAYDTWRRPQLTFEDFRAGVHARNGGLQLHSGVPARFVTTNLNELELVVWDHSDGPRPSETGAEVSNVVYGDADRADAYGAAHTQPPLLLNGTVMNTGAEAVVEIRNPQRGSTVTLDFSDEKHPRRFDSETGESEVAGFNNEVWLDFEYAGPAEGDVCRPLNTLAGALRAVADAGVIQVVPGTTPERGSFYPGKRVSLVAPLGGVTVGTAARGPAPPAEEPGGISNHDVWVQLGWFDNVQTRPPYLFNSLSQAIDAVAQGGIVHIQPGSTHGQGRTTVGRGKRCTLVAPIGGVTIGVPA